MFRPMRRIRQQLSQAECDAILQKCSSGVLAVAGDDGYPYTVPMSYLYQDGRLYFHCAKSGHKLDAVRREPKVSFCVVGQDAGRRYVQRGTDAVDVIDAHVRGATQSTRHPVLVLV